MNPAECGERAYNCYIKCCVNLCQTNCTKCPYMGKHCKQGKGSKWLTIHKHLPTNHVQCMCSTSIVYTNELGKRKAAVVSLCPMKRTKNMEVYKISGSSKKKRLQAKTMTDRLNKNFRGRLVAHK